MTLSYFQPELTQTTSAYSLLFRTSHKGLTGKSSTSNGKSPNYSLRDLFELLGHQGTSLSWVIPMCPAFHRRV